MYVSVSEICVKSVAQTSLLSVELLATGNSKELLNIIVWVTDRSLKAVMLLNESRQRNIRKSY